MDNFFKTLFASLCKQYEILVYERSRRNNVAAQRDINKLYINRMPDRDDRLEQEIKLTEQLLNILARYKHAI